MSTTLAADLRRYLARHYPDATFSDFSFLTRGWECDIYAFRMTFAAGHPHDFVLRFYSGSGGSEKASLEGSGIPLLHRAGYPVPQVLLAESDESILGRAFIIMDRLDGQNLRAVLRTVAREEQDRLIRQFSGLMAQLHNLDWRPFTTHSAHFGADPTAVLNQVINFSRRLFVKFELEGFLAILDWLDAHKTAISVRPAIAHLDFHANNVFLRSNGRMAVIDWSQLSVLDYRCDLSWTRLIMGERGEPHWRQDILKYYVAATGQPVDDLDYFDVISFIKNLSGTVISLHAGPESLGLRSMAAAYSPNLRLMRWASQRIKDITGLTIPEVEAIIRKFE